MSTQRISHSTDGDAGVLQWGATGTPHAYREGDDDGMMGAYRKAVAEALSQGERFEDEVERSIARELQESIGITFGPRDELAGLQFDWDDVLFDPRTARKDAQDTLLIGWFPSGDTADAIGSLLGDTYSPAVVSANTGFPLHLTMLFISDPDVDNTKVDPQLIAAVAKLYSRWREPMKGCISGLGRFVGPEDTDVIVALVDVPGLLGTRHCLKDELMCQGAVPYDSPLYNETHGYVPHITLAYVPKSQPSPPPMTETIPICIDSISLSYGAADQVTFALGWSAEGGPAAVAPEGSYDPYFASREALSLTKAGKVLSKKNLEALQEAHATMGKVIETATARMAGTDAPEGDDQVDATKRREFLAAVAGDPVHDYAMQYLVTKSVGEDRFTLGPLYAPMRMDAHGEFTAADTLQKAMWGYMQDKFDSGDNRLNLQHGDLGEIQVANLVEMMAWPYEHDIVVKTAAGVEQTLTMPAGTVYLGAVWDEDAWPLVKSGKLNGWSLGGKAVRVSTDISDMDHMGYKVASRATAPAKAKMHAFEESADDPAKCATCDQTQAGGSHFNTKKSAADLDREEELALLEAAHDQDVALARAEAERDTTKREAKKQRSMFREVLKTIRERKEPDLHVHLPDQSVTLNEAPVELDLS